MVLDKVWSVGPDGIFGKGAIKLGENIVNHVILLVLNALNDSSEGLEASGKEILSHSIDLLKQAVQEARSISHGLMSRVLNRFGLAFAISEIINNINNTSDLKFLYRHNIEDFRFKEEIEMGVYRTLQELIKNILKHSKASKANLSIFRNESELLIEIKDNGIGIESGTINNPSSGGIGLRNMRSRIEYLGGVLEINEKIDRNSCAISSVVQLFVHRFYNYRWN